MGTKIDQQQQEQANINTEAHQQRSPNQGRSPNQQLDQNARSVSESKESEPEQTMQTVISASEVPLEPAVIISSPAASSPSPEASPPRSNFFF